MTLAPESAATPARTHSAELLLLVTIGIVLGLVCTWVAIAIVLE